MSTVDGNIQILLGKAGLYGQVVVEQGYDIDLPAQPDITVVEGDTRARDMAAGMGYLYNRYTIEDARGLAPEGWRVAGLWDAEKAFHDQFDYWRLHFGLYDLTQEAYVDRYPNSGIYKSPRTDPDAHPRWDTPNESGYGGLPQNETGFTALPGGIRTPAGNFHYLGQAAAFWALFLEHGGEDSPFHVAWVLWNMTGSSFLTWKDTDFGQAGAYNAGLSVRLVMEDPTKWFPGLTVQDADGNRYDTVRVTNNNGYWPYDEVWTVQNLVTTKFQNGDSIAHLTDNDEWETTTAPAYCSYNNNENLALGMQYQKVGGIDVRNAYEERLITLHGRIVEERDTETLIGERVLI